MRLVASQKDSIRLVKQARVIVFMSEDQNCLCQKLASRLFFDAALSERFGSKIQEGLYYTTRNPDSKTYYRYKALGSTECLRICFK
jgi:hypothetical protein